MFSTPIVRNNWRHNTNIFIFFPGNLFFNDSMNIFEEAPHQFEFL